MDFASGAALAISLVSLGVSIYVARLQHKQNKRDIRVEFGFRPMKDGDYTWDKVLVIEAFNDGHRPVVIDEYGFELRDRFRFTPRRMKAGDGIGVRIVTPYRFTIAGIRGSDQLPYLLEPGKSLVLWLDRVQSKSIVLKELEMKIGGQARLIAILRDQLDNTYHSRPSEFANTLWDVPTAAEPPLIPWN